MVNISKFGDSAIKFTFTDNYRYLHNGEIEVPLNSLILVVDESDMVTFKKIDGDPFVSFLISDSNFESKETLIYFYKTSMVGSTGGGSESGITSGDVQTMIDTSLEDYYDIDEIDAALSGKADSSAVTEAITAAVSGKADSSAVTEAINSAVSGKADTSSVYTKSEVDTALSGKQDVSGMTAYTTSSDVESYVSGYTYDKATIDSKVASGGTFDPTNYYDKTATDALLDNKFDASAFTSYSAATDTALNNKANKSAAVGGYQFGNTSNVDFLEYKSVNYSKIGSNIYYPHINGKGIFTTSLIYAQNNFNFQLVETSAITSSVTSASTDSQVPSAKAVYDALQESGGGGVSESAFTSYSAATDARISEDEEVTAAALNALNDGKQDTLIAGSGITISGNVISAEGGNLVIELTQAEYNSLVDKDPNAFYIITDATEINISDYYTSAQTQSAINAAVSGKADTSSVYTKSEVDTALNAKQDTLVSGTNIKTINNESLLGSGNIDIQGGGGITSGEVQTMIDESISGKTNQNDNLFTIRTNVIETVVLTGGEKLRIIFAFDIIQNNQIVLSTDTVNDKSSLLSALATLGFDNKIYEIRGINYNDDTSKTSYFGEFLGHKCYAVLMSYVPDFGSITIGLKRNNVYYTLDSVGSGKYNYNYLSNKPSITTSITSASTDSEIPSAKAVNDKLGGLSLVKLSQSEYDALTTKDDNTLFVIIN